MDTPEPPSRTLPAFDAASHRSLVDAGLVGGAGGGFLCRPGVAPARGGVGIAGRGLPGLLGGGRICFPTYKRSGYPYVMTGTKQSSCDPRRWTIERMDAFIRALRRTRNVAAAARAAGMSRQAAYRLRARLPGHPFDKAWEAAMRPRRVFERMLQGYTR